MLFIFQPCIKIIKICLENFIIVNNDQMYIKFILKIFQWKL